jgi:hypothetical protein
VICPLCRAEYRTGFTHCSDCNVGLIAELRNDKMETAEMQGYEYRNHAEQPLQVIWHGDSESECVALCKDLQKVGLYYRVAQEVKSRSIRMRVDWSYRIGVLASDSQRAIETLGLQDESARKMEQQSESEEDEEEDHSEFALPECNPSEADQAIAEERERSRSYLNDWYPEDATATIWQQEKSEIDFRHAIEMGLKENLIHCRSVAGPAGLYKICVLAEDETRAREIVREIVEVVDDWLTS